jgi:hypothetical protein
MINAGVGCASRKNNRIYAAMIIAHYAHRLPADYDIALIRERAKRRSALWNDVPELYFKAFLLRERGRLGATASSYSSLYLWQRDQAFREFLVAGRYRTVTDSFGRAEIATRFALDARRGPASTADIAVLDETPIPPDADLTERLSLAIADNRAAAQQPETAAAVVGIDTRNWTLLRIALVSDEPKDARVGTRYEILHLAKPLLDGLPRGAD